MTKPINLSDVYKGTFASRPRFDDGGGISYISTPTNPYYGVDSSGSVYSSPTEPAATDPSLAPVSTSQAEYKQAINNATAARNSIDLQSPTPSQSNSGALSSALSGVGKFLGSNVGALSLITGLLSAAGHYSTLKNGQPLPKLPGLPGVPGTTSPLPALPGQPAGGSTGYGPAGGYGYQNYQGLSPGASGLGYAPRTQAPPKPMNSYYTYGQGPEQQFFQQVQPSGGTIAPTPGKKGGRVRKFAAGGLNEGVAPGAPMSGVGPNQQSPFAMGAPQQPATTQPNQPLPGAPGAVGALGAAAAPAPNQAAAPAQNQNMLQAQPIAQQMPAANPYGPQGSAPAGTAPLARQMPSIAPPSPTPTQPSMSNVGMGMPPMNAGALNAAAQRAAFNPSSGGLFGGPGRMEAGMGPAARPGMPQMPQHAARMGFEQNRPMWGRRAMMFAHGGDVEGALSVPEQGSRYVRGPGDGTSDDIPARLANGEYVLSADVVSGLGNGDNESGAKNLDAFVHNLRVHKAQNAMKGKLPHDAKPIHKYMGGQ